MKSWILFVALFVYSLLDSQSVVKGAMDGVHLSTTVIIPSLFPFIFLSTLSSQGLLSLRTSLLKPIEKLCGMPYGSGGLLLLGVCGGYPVGAQNVYAAYSQGIISKSDAQRLLSFCSNAGPSFIFGMLGGIFKDVRLCWMLWLSQILSAVIVGAILPHKSSAVCRLRSGHSITVTEGLEKALLVCSKICGWVVLFRCVLSVLETRIAGQLPVYWKVLLTGILELSNGCIYVGSLEDPMPAFLLCGGMLTFGGLCVLLQTKSVINGLSVKYYLIGKLLQTVIVLPILYLLWKITVAF